MNPIQLPPDILEGIESLDQIPTLPAVANRLLSIAKDSVGSFKELEDVIQTDPSLAAEILRVANSPFYRVPGGVANLRRAVMVLGIDEIRRICLSITVMAAFPRRKDRPSLDREAFWAHSSACAVAARRLGEYLKLDLDGDEFVAGLIHDTGKLILDLCFHDRYDEAIRITIDEGISMRAAEQRVFGIDHAVVGAWLGQRWEFPDRLVEAVQFHHEPERAEVDPVLAAIIYLADLFSRVTGNGFGGERTPVVIGETPAWRILSAARKDPDPLDLAELTFRLDEEMSQNKGLLAPSS